MGLGIRARLLAWFGLVVLPAFGVGWFTLDLIDDRFVARVEADLVNARRLESARIVDVLASYEEDGASLAAGPHVVDFVGGVNQARRSPSDPPVVGGYDGFGVVDPTAAEPLAELADALQNKARTTGSEVVELQLIGVDGDVYGETSGFSWSPYVPDIVATTLTDGTARFGNAFRSPDGGDRLGLVTPIVGADGEVLGVLVQETDLGPVVDLVVEHEGFGDTSEAHIAQPTAEGDAEFITLLRFERDAAFTKVVPSARQLPINQSLEAPGGTVVRSPDYRGVESILAIETIESTGWGLVIKIDTAEALAPVGEVRDLLLAAGFTTLLLIVGCSAVLLNPLARRLKRLSLAAQRVAAGQYQARIGDGAGDELGDVARSIDQLAADLDADIRMRTIVEDKLRHQASHDHLTGLHNRQYATERIQALSVAGAPSWSMLFLDLDRFKAINDGYGHAVGDEVLRVVAERLTQAFAHRAIVARWGGDEFVVILPDTDRLGALAVADEVRAAFDSPIATTVGHLDVGCSVGVAAADSDSASLDQVLTEADTSMFAQKPRERERRQAWSGGERLATRAMAEGRVELHYQPIVVGPFDRWRVVGAEALVRIRTEDGALLPPAAFLDDIAQREAGRELDAHVADRAIATVAHWHRTGLVEDQFRMAINVGPGSARHDGLAEAVLTALHRHGLPPHLLVVEISEAADAINLDALHHLADHGVITAIDDIGVSRSNFDRLLEMRPDYAKLDRRWFTIGRRSETTVLLNLVQTCHQLGLDIIAEGIETPVQRRLAEELGIRLAQGFLFGRPIPAEEFGAAWLGAIDRAAAIPGPAPAIADRADRAGAVEVTTGRSIC